MSAKTFPPEVLRGVEVAVASDRSTVLLGVREGFVRYFYEVLGRPVPVAVVPQEIEEVPHGLASSDGEMIERCAARARALDSQLGDAYQFYLAVEEAGWCGIGRDTNAYPIDATDGRSAAVSCLLNAIYIHCS